jgi:hypothetical protein
MVSSAHGNANSSSPSCACGEDTGEERSVAYPRHKFSSLQGYHLLANCQTKDRLPPSVGGEPSGRRTADCS